MCSNTIFGLLFSLILNSYSGSSGHWIHLRSSMQPSLTDDLDEINNGTDLPQKPIDSNLTNTSENEVLFWATPDKNDTVEVDSGVHMHIENESEDMSNPFQPLEDGSEVEPNDTFIATTNSAEPVEIDHKGEENKTVLHKDIPHPIMDEKIVLQRNNCHLEIPVQENHDLQIEIKFGKIQNNTSGKCYITLNGQGNSMLGVLISNICLYQNGTQGEKLKVITTESGSDFVLKEYYSWTKYQPLLLTETNKVYIVLHYHIINVPPNLQDSHFNLEVFSYHKHENYLHQGISYSESHFQYNNGAQNLSTSFFPYFY